MMNKIVDMKIDFLTINYLLYYMMKLKVFFKYIEEVKILRFY